MARFFDFIFLPNSPWPIAILALLVLVITIAAKAWRDSPAFWLALVFLALFFPHIYLVWHGDAAEVGRHAVQASVQLRLSLWLLLVLSLDTMVMRARQN